MSRRVGLCASVPLWLFDFSRHVRIISPMNLHGQNLIAGDKSGQGEVFHAIDPSTSQPLPGDFHEGTTAEADRALQAAHEAFQTFRKTDGKTRAALLDAIAGNIEAIG